MVPCYCQPCQAGQDEEISFTTGTIFGDVSNDVEDQLDVSVVAPDENIIVGGRSPGDFEVALPRSGKNWRSIGLRLEPTKAVALRVAQVIEEDSLVGEWNKSHQDQQVKVGSLIIEVNGISGSVDKMVHAVSSTPKGGVVKFYVR
eukprot:TRINITY_DN17451_c0_g3_i3.p1 TRINITY_DN17451_c0_g3~~TRINITY_DN17451_c0_g3_i3.p1  ORF type:complete len:145 (-),score=24.64 TRINITY_DN17451_c0_g3_i3:96-530(-)